MDFTIEPWMIEEAQTYAVLSARHTSDRHDFHRGGIDGKAENMFVGKLGEKVFKAWLKQQDLPDPDRGEPKPLPYALDVPSERGKRLAAAFRSAVQHTRYYRDYLTIGSDPCRWRWCASTRENLYPLRKSDRIAICAD